MKYIIPILFLILTSCKKYEVNTVSGNSPQNDPTVANEVKNNFINKLYIKLLDRKADSSEFAQALDILDIAPAEQDQRKAVITFIKNNPEYYHVLWKHIRELLLDGKDTADINKTYNDLYTDWTTATGNAKDALEYEWKRMENLLDAADKLSDNTYTWEELQKHSCYNYIYEDINMGSENYVVSVFQNLIQRYPTNQELSEAKNMVTGKPAVLFLMAGETQTDFLNIFFSARSYFEGQVSYLFKNNIFRDPTSQEFNYYTQYYIDNGSFESLYLEVLSSEIYFNQ